MKTELIPTSEVSFGEVVLYSTGAARLTPARLRQSWHSNALHYAVDKLLQTACFLAPGLAETHQECRKFWESLPATDWAEWADGGHPETLRDSQYYAFYCLGAPNHCSNCGKEWTGLGRAEKDDPSLGIYAGSLLSKRCPGCLEPYDAMTLQALHWREQLAGTIGFEVESFDQVVRASKVDMVFRLAQFLVNGRVVAGDNSLANAENLKHGILARLVEYGLNGTDAYNASDWTAKAPHVLPTWGLDPKAIEEAWTRNQMRECCGALNETYQALCKASVSGLSLPDLTLPDDPPAAERAKTIRARLAAWGKPEETAPQAMILQVDGHEYLLSLLTAPLAARARLDGLPRCEVKELKLATWLNELFA